MPTVDEVQRVLDKLADGIKRADATHIGLVNPAPYVMPIETGRTRSGRWVRRAGPARMIARGVEETASAIAAEVARALPDGAAAVEAAMVHGGERLKAATQSYTPVLSGNLRSKFTIRRGR